MRRWLLVPLGIVTGVALAFLLPEYTADCIDCHGEPHTYFFWDTMERSWAAGFYALVGLGVGLAAVLILRVRDG